MKFRFTLSRSVIFNFATPKFLSVYGPRLLKIWRTPNYCYYHVKRESSKRNQFPESGKFLIQIYTWQTEREDRYCISMSKAEVRSSKLGLRFNCGIRRSLAVAPVESDPNYPRINRRKWNRIVGSRQFRVRIFLSSARC